MVADVVVMLVEATALIVGIDAAVEKVKLADVALPAESAEIAV
jgi:hypothetical protein